jgi:hypothetical protein
MAAARTSATATSALVMRPISGQTERVLKLSYTSKNQAAAIQSSSEKTRNGQWSESGASGALVFTGSRSRIQYAAGTAMAMHRMSSRRTVPSTTLFFMIGATPLRFLTGLANSIRRSMNVP